MWDERGGTEEGGWRVEEGTMYAQCYIVTARMTFIEMLHSLRALKIRRQCP